MNTDEKILQTLEDLKQGQQRLEQGQGETNKRLDNLEQGQTHSNRDIAILKNGQAHNTTMVEAVLAGQEELQKTTAREATVLNVAERLTRKVNDHEERIIELEKEAGIPHPHKH